MKKLIALLSFLVVGTAISVVYQPIPGKAQGGYGNFGPTEFTLYADPSGACGVSFLELVINRKSGNLSSCVAGTWTNVGQAYAVGSQLTAAATLTVVSPVQHITSSATTITTITASWLPPSGGCIRLIPDAAETGATTSTGGNIALASTFVADKVLEMCFDPTAKLWFPSY